MYDELVRLPPGNTRSPHSVRIDLADGSQQFTLTGVIVPHLPGPGPQWQQRTLRAMIPIPGLEDGQKLAATQWAPSVSLAAINADGAPGNPGWAIDGFDLVDPRQPADHLTLDVQTAVRDADCRLLRMTYQILVVGSIV